jgi:hypothetical protein
MSDDDTDEVECGEHGQAHATYVCRCLVAQPVQRWHGDYPDEDNPWPDAWCERCNAAYEREGGEWNERNQDAAKIALLCHHCYEAKRGASVQRLAGRAAERWRRFVDDCRDELIAKQAALVSEFALGEHERWDYDQAKGELVFSNGGVVAVRANFELVGTLSTTSDTWLWAWANLHDLPGVRQRITAVRERGEREDWPHLTVPKWPADLCDAEGLVAVAVHVLGARGFYRTPYEHGYAYKALTVVQRMQ